MREKKEILESGQQMGVNTFISTPNEKLVLEVLIDIRDALRGISQAVSSPHYDTGRDGALRVVTEN